MSGGLYGLIFWYQGFIECPKVLKWSTTFSIPSTSMQLVNLWGRIPLEGC